MSIAAPESFDRFYIEPRDFSNMPFARVRRVVHVDELSGVLTGEKPANAASTRMRTIVTPDTWPIAYHSGNVAVEHDWASSIRDQRFYWLREHGTGGELRILVTNDRLDDQLQAYDPSVAAGPWRVQANGEHTWNSRYPLEFVFEQPLPATGILRVLCVNHGRRQCDVYGTGCKDLGRGAKMAGARLLALALGSGFPSDTLARLVEPSELRTWIAALANRLSRLPVGGAVHSGTSEARELAVAVAAAFAASSRVEMRAISGRFSSHRDQIDELTRALSSWFGRDLFGLL